MSGNSPQLSLLKLMASRENFENYFSYLDFDILQREVCLLLKDFKKYYAIHEDHDAIDFGVFHTLFQNQWHKMSLSPEEHKSYSVLINNINNTDSSEVEPCLLSFFSLETINRIEKFWKEDFNIERIRQELDKYEDKSSQIIQSQDKDVFTFEQVDFSEIDKKNGIPYALPTLQSNLGSLCIGNFVVIAAASGVGKSAFMITQAAHTFKYLHSIGSHSPILYFNSEGSLHELWARFMSNLIGDKLPNGIEDVIAHKDKIGEIFKRKYNPSLFLTFDANGKSPNFIRTKIKKYKPSLILIDLLDAMNFGKSDAAPLALKNLYDKLRALSSEFCPIIGTSQAGSTAKRYDKDKQKTIYKKWLSDDDLYYSKGGKQGAADTMIMIGMDENYPNERYINVAKRKRGQSAKFVCNFVEQYSLYEEFKYGN